MCLNTSLTASSTVWGRWSGLHGRNGSVRWWRGLVGCICFRCEPSSLLPHLLGCEKPSPHFPITVIGVTSVVILCSPGHTVSPETMSWDDPRLPAWVSSDIHLIIAPWKQVIHFPTQFYTSISHINIREWAKIILPNVKGTAKDILLYPVCLFVCLLHWLELSRTLKVLIWKHCPLSYSLCISIKSFSQSLGCLYALKTMLPRVVLNTSPFPHTLKFSKLKLLG